MDKEEDFTDWQIWEPCQVDTHWVLGSCQNTSFWSAVHFSQPRQPFGVSIPNYKGSFLKSIVPYFPLCKLSRTSNLFIAGSHVQSIDHVKETSIDGSCRAFISIEICRRYLTDNHTHWCIYFLRRYFLRRYIVPQIRLLPHRVQHGVVSIRVVQTFPQAFQRFKMAIKPLPLSGILRRHRNASTHRKI